MSGGSFDYLYCKTPTDGMAQYLRKLREMVEYCRERANYGDLDDKHRRRCREAADHLEAHLHRAEIAMRSLSVRHAALRGLMKAVEWECSADSSVDAIADAVDELVEGSE